MSTKEVNLCEKLYLRTLKFKVTTTILFKKNIYTYDGILDVMTL